MKRVGPGRGSSRGGVHGECVATCVEVSAGIGGSSPLERRGARGRAPAGVMPHGGKTGGKDLSDKFICSHLLRKVLRPKSQVRGISRLRRDATCLRLLLHARHTRAARTPQVCPLGPRLAGLGGAASRVGALECGGEWRGRAHWPLGWAGCDPTRARSPMCALSPHISVKP